MEFDEFSGGAYGLHLDRPSTNRSQRLGTLTDLEQRNAFEWAGPLHSESDRSLAFMRRRAILDIPELGRISASVSFWSYRADPEEYLEILVGYPALSEVARTGYPFGELTERAEQQLQTVDDYFVVVAQRLGDCGWECGMIGDEAAFEFADASAYPTFREEGVPADRTVTYLGFNGPSMRVLRPTNRRLFW